MARQQRRSSSRTRAVRLAYRQDGVAVDRRQAPDLAVGAPECVCICCITYGAG